MLSPVDYRQVAKRTPAGRPFCIFILLRSRIMKEENKKVYNSPSVTVTYMKTQKNILDMSTEGSDDDNSYGGYIPIPSSVEF